MATDFSDILGKLDFNAVYSGDPIARVYFHQAAAAIRTLEADAHHWERMALIERANALSAHQQARGLGKCLAELESAPDPLPHSPS